MAKYIHVDPLAPFEEKLTNEYGLLLAKNIASEWFNGGILLQSTNDCEFQRRKDYINHKRNFVRGEVDLTRFKNRISKTKTDLQYLNLDWRYSNIAEKFCKTVINGISDENYILDIRSTDKITAKLKKDQEYEYRKLMATVPLMKSHKANFGIDLMEGKDIPEDENEMSIWLEMKDRPKIEIAEEILINWIKETNDWDFISQSHREDLVVCGIAVSRVFISPTDGVTVKYVDPENYIHSHVKKNNFEDKKYEGVVEEISIGELQRESNLNIEQLRDIAKRFALINKISDQTDFSNYTIDDMLSMRIQVLRFAYKTVKNLKYKKKIRNGKTVKVTPKPSSYVAPERKDVGTLEKTFDTWLEGNFILGTEIVYGWKECENVYDDVMNKALSPYITISTNIRKNKLRSFVDNIEKESDELNFLALKMQQLTSELTPDMKVINLDALAEIADGEGGAKREAWQSALDLIGARGIVLEQTVDLGDEGGVQRVAAAKPYAVQQGSAITVLLNQYAHWLNMVRENTGINPARDGMMSADALVGVNQMAQLASNTVTKDIADASVNLNKRICEVISTRVHTIYAYREGHSLRELYDNIVGTHLGDMVSLMKNRHLHEFGFVFMMIPSQQELQKFREDLTIALNNQSIDVAIKSEAESIYKTNPKLANQFLQYSIRKLSKKRMEEQMVLAQNKSENDAKAAQAKVQAEVSAYQMKEQIGLEIYGKKAMIDIDKKRAELELQQPENEIKFQRDVYLKQIENHSTVAKHQMQEDRKDERTKLQATQQSEMIDQRLKNKDPKDFTAEIGNFGFDSLNQ